MKKRWGSDSDATATGLSSVEFGDCQRLGSAVEGVLPDGRSISRLISGVVQIYGGARQ